VSDGRLGEGDGDRCTYSADGVTVAEGCRPCTPRNSAADGDKEVLNVHGYECVEKQVLAPVGGPVSRQPWRVRALSGIVYYENMHALSGGDELHPYECFLTMFPMDQLSRMVRLTNGKLQLSKKTSATGGEVLKWIGVIVLGNRYEFGRRADLWATHPSSRLLPAPNFGRLTGMSRNRFEDLWAAMIFSSCDIMGMEVDDEAAPSSS
jgi:hypothetical protein